MRYLWRRRYATEGPGLDRSVLSPDGFFRTSRSQLWRWRAAATEFVVLVGILKTVIVEERLRLGESRMDHGLEVAELGSRF